MSEHEKVHQTVTWELFHTYTRSLAETLKPIGPFQGIIAISRGGLVPTAILAYRLNISRIETIGLSAYDDKDKPRDKVRMLSDIYNQLFFEDEGLGWLVVDDIVDQGSTMRLVRRMLPRAIRVAVFAKQRSIRHVHRVGRLVNDDVWFDFPYQ